MGDRSIASLLRTQNNTKQTKTYIHGPSGIRTRDRSTKATEDNTRLPKSSNSINGN
jgi:hypothetical protein